MAASCRQWALLCMLAALLAGCGGPPGPPRYRVRGTVTCGGRPVPAGEVLFSPDGRRGNKGPQGIAIIKDGRYDTEGSRAPALESPGGGLIAEHELTIDLPQADSEQPIEIPAAAKPGRGPEI